MLEYHEVKSNYFNGQIDPLQVFLLVTSEEHIGRGEIDSCRMCLSDFFNREVLDSARAMHIKLDYAANVQWILEWIS